MSAKMNSNIYLVKIQSSSFSAFSVSHTYISSQNASANEKICHGNRNNVIRSVRGLESALWWECGTVIKGKNHDPSAHGTKRVIKAQDYTVIVKSMEVKEGEGMWKMNLSA